MSEANLRQRCSELEMVESLNRSINTAGGALYYVPEQLKQLTVWDLVTKLAGNGIRFICEAPADETL